MTLSVEPSALLNNTGGSIGKGLFISHGYVQKGDLLGSFIGEEVCEFPADADFESTEYAIGLRDTNKVLQCRTAALNGTCIMSMANSATNLYRSKKGVEGNRFPNDYVKLGSRNNNARAITHNGKVYLQATKNLNAHNGKIEILWPYGKGYHTQLSRHLLRQANLYNVSSYVDDYGDGYDDSDCCGVDGDGDYDFGDAIV